MLNNFFLIGKRKRKTETKFHIFFTSVFYPNLIFASTLAPRLIVSKGDLYLYRISAPFLSI